MPSPHETLKIYFERKQKLAGFSMRALAARLEISPSFLSRILSGKKPIPAELLPKLARALDVEPERLMPPPKAEKKEALSRAVEDWSLASMESNQILRHWYYIPILELTTLKNFDGEAASISRRLKLPMNTTEAALRELVSLGLLSESKGLYAKTEAKLRIVSSKSLPLIRKFHDDMLGKAQNELRNGQTEAEFQRRLIMGITVSADPAKIQEAKARLSEFLHQLANDLAADEGEEVFHLAAQLFPLTK